MASACRYFAHGAEQAKPSPGADFRISYSQHDHEVATPDSAAKLMKGSGIPLLATPMCNPNIHNRAE
jgi:hypothetical protein